MESVGVEALQHGQWAKNSTYFPDAKLGLASVSRICVVQLNCTRFPGKLSLLHSPSDYTANSAPPVVGDHLYKYGLSTWFLHPDKHPLERLCHWAHQKVCRSQARGDCGHGVVATLIASIQKPVKSRARCGWRLLVRCPWCLGATAGTRPAPRRSCFRGSGKRVWRPRRNRENSAETGGITETTETQPMRSRVPTYCLVVKATRPTPATLAAWLLRLYAGAPSLPIPTHPALNALPSSTAYWLGACWNCFAFLDVERPPKSRSFGLILAS
jgi:hypothetical protein